jgi:hypothetical protein
MGFHAKPAKEQRRNDLLPALFFLASLLLCDPCVKNKMQNERSYWNKWYLAVLVFLVLQIIIFYFITKQYS